MKRAAMIMIMCVTLTGCAAVKDYIPSFWDDNQSASIVTARLHAENLDCEAAQAPQVFLIAQNLRWFQLYSESKGSLQKDVLRVVEPMSRTVKDWQARLEKQETAPSKAYCEIKKKILIQQAGLAAQAVLGRY